MNLAGKTAFITGGASGIGLAMAEAFARAGCRVMLADIEEAALRVAEHTLTSAGLDVRGIVCDVADPAAVDDAATRTIAAFGKVHILCNNAGVGAGSGIDDISLDSWRWVLDVNLMGVVHGVGAFLPRIRAHGEGGHIVNTASMAGMLGAAMGFSPYAASKFAVVAMSEGLAAELKPHRIGVTVLCPAYVRTRIADAGRNRPERYGPHKASALAATVAELVDRGIDPHKVAARVLDAVRNNQLYAFTQPEVRGELAARFEAILAAYDKPAGSPQ